MGNPRQTTVSVDLSVMKQPCDIFPSYHEKQIGLTEHNFCHALKKGQ